VRRPPPSFQDQNGHFLRNLGLSKSLPNVSNRCAAPRRAFPMRKTYRNDLSELSRLSADIEAFCEQQQIDFESASALQLCLDEVATNVISYAWKDEQLHTFEVSLKREYNVVTATVRDDGDPFDPTTQVKDPDLTADIESREIGGLGVHFCRTLMQRFAYTRDGAHNVLTLERALK